MLTHPATRIREDHKRRRRGSLLVYALWMMTILSVMALVVGSGVRQRIHETGLFEKRQKIVRARQAGIWVAITYLRTREASGSFTILDSVTDSLPLGSGDLDGASYRLVLDAPAVQGDQNSAQASTGEYSHSNVSNKNQSNTTCGIMDENRFLNLNSADRLTLKAFFEQFGGLDDDAAGRIAAAVVDYRDPDDDVSTYADRQGSEGAYFAAVGLKPKNRPFDFESELLEVPGVDKVVYARVRPWVTVFGDGSLNLNTANGWLLRTADLEKSLAEKILVYRAGPDGVEGTADDGFFVNLGLVEKQLSMSYKLREQERISLRHAISRRRVGTGSDFFRIGCRAAGQTAGVTVVFSPRYGIMRWFEE